MAKSGLREGPLRTSINAVEWITQSAVHMVVVVRRASIAVVGLRGRAGGACPVALSAGGAIEEEVGGVVRALFNAGQRRSELDSEDA